MPRRLLTALTLLFALPAAAQPDVDTIFRVEPVAGTTWQITAQNFPRPGDLAISSVWSEADFELVSQDGLIGEPVLNRGYITSLFGPPEVSGIGTDQLRVSAATMPGGTIFGGPDNDDSNPLFVMSFSYTGTAAGLNMSLVGQNAIAFVDPANPLFGDVAYYFGALILEPRRSFAVVVVPSASTLSVLALSCLGMSRRRR